MLELESGALAWASGAGLDRRVPVSVAEGDMTEPSTTQPMTAIKTTASTTSGGFVIARLRVPGSMLICRT